MTRGQRLKLLRKHYDLERSDIVDTMKLSAVSIGNYERDQADWISDNIWTGLSRTFGFTNEQARAYVDGTLSWGDALDIADAVVLPRQQAIEEQRKAQDRLTEVFQRAETDGPLFDGAREYSSKRLMMGNELAKPVTELAKRVRHWSDIMRRALEAEEQRQSGGHRLK